MEVVCKIVGYQPCDIACFAVYFPTSISMCSYALWVLYFVQQVGYKVLKGNFNI